MLSLSAIFQIDLEDNTLRHISLFVATSKAFEPEYVRSYSWDLLFRGNRVESCKKEVEDDIRTQEVSEVQR